MIKRRETREVIISDKIKIGKSNLISIQTMYNRKLPLISESNKIVKLLDYFKELKVQGCDIMRITFNEEGCFPIFKLINKSKIMPIVADIHFDYRLALLAIESGVDKIRINPGNIGAKWKVEEVIKKAKDNNTAIRIGLNSGSLPPNTHKVDKPIFMAETAMRYVDLFESNNFNDIVVSLKSSDIFETIEANRYFAKANDIPLHLGLTEAGTTINSVCKSTICLSSLLQEGIGDTVRISIAGSLEDEIESAKSLLTNLGLRKGVNVVACPRCGRSNYDNVSLVKNIEKELNKLNIDRNITIAVMGCVVNGPGEAKNSDFAVVGSDKIIYLYKKGKLLTKLENNENLIYNILSIYRKEFNV